MAHFNQDEDASYSAYNPSLSQPHFQSARGTGRYAVAPGSAYLPPPSRDSSASPPPLRPPPFASSNSYLHFQSDSHQDLNQMNPTQPRNLIDHSPSRVPDMQAPPAPPAHRDLHAGPVPVPPPHHRSTSSTDYDHYGRPTAAAGLAGPGAGSLGPAAALHSRNNSYQSNPFDDPYEADPYHDRSRGYSPERTPYAPAAAGAGIGMGAAAAANSFEMRPPMGDRPISHSGANPANWRSSVGDLGSFNPQDIAEDDDDLEPIKGKKRGAAAAAAAAGGGAAGFIAGVTSRDASGNYGQVPGGEPEKSGWLRQQTSKSKRVKWLVTGLIALVIVLAVVGGALGAVLSKKSSSSNATAGDGGPDLTKDSPEIQALMNNKNLHKVFPGIDYTPLNAQYPACLTVPPEQNNVTKDVAILSQLTPQIRLYGNDCNQTEMLLHAIDVLGLNSTVKVWMGVWLENNQTTNDRQMNHMWELLDTNGADPFAGIIVGNEVLFRQDMTQTQLISILDGVRTNLTNKHDTLKLATADIGSKWTSTLAEAVDVVMANDHPFFAGVDASEAAAWTWNFWETNDVVVYKNLTGKIGYISETGWPSSGGNDCGIDDSTGQDINCTSPTQGSVAGINEMNTFMSGWVCDSLKNGTNYFWFEAFDEPWKYIFNTPTDGWETKWGLMDENRNLKSGVQIPDCGGQQATLPT